PFRREDIFKNFLPVVLRYNFTERFSVFRHHLCQLLHERKMIEVEDELFCQLIFGLGRIVVQMPEHPACRTRCRYELLNRKPLQLMVVQLYKPVALRTVKLYDAVPDNAGSLQFYRPEVFAEQLYLAE